jgi:hypothetical protein
MSKKRQSNTVKRGRLVSQLSKERILQLSNDLSEDIQSGSVQDWRTVAQYFRDELDINSIRLSVAVIDTAPLNGN